LNYEDAFPRTIAIPDALLRLRDWLDIHGYPISGYFELRNHDPNAIKYWFGADTALDRLAMFGAGPDGSPYCIWLQDDGRTPIVHMGSEGVNNFVLAPDFIQFLRLLAVGYDEIGFDILSQPPAAEGVNPAFQGWVREAFSVEVPPIGLQITEPAQRTHDNF
jgi:hypothetical protein